MHPQLFDRCLLLCTAPRISPFLGATVEAQRMALEADPSFRQARSLAGGREGLKCARAQALISYRCFKGYGLTQAEEDPDTLFAGRVASYERYQGEKLVRRGFDAYSYYCLCNALDSHNAFPPAEGRQWAAWIPGAQYVEISSNFGHDGFLLETAKLSALIL